MVAAIVSTVLGGFGNAAALVLFLSPIPTFIRIVKDRSTKDFSGITYVVTWFNCALWVLYGFRKMVTLIITINMAGLIIQSIYAAVFTYFASSTRTRRTMLLLWAGEMALTAAIGVGVLEGVHKKSVQEDIFGWMCVVLNIGMYWAPLSIMWTVIRTRSVEFMPLLLTLMVFINSVFWAFYGLLQKNIYVLIPNGMGILGGAVQIILYLWFFRTEESKAAKLRSKQAASPEAAGGKIPNTIEMC